ncbi:hypothetical protein [Shouchella lonarensis]|uniref:Transmembrane protein n=1 Tax=Shouchella lonarensis TaxID=1464122 RepID=A0A1G6MK29_9BACI|nr:hypothetical protein [Shouchella lonarensis]SDC55978.1 hypothetical protein SAMN05421737_11056 [Shouchella lonarensis]
MKEEARCDGVSEHIFVGAGWALLLSIPMWGGIIFLGMLLWHVCM